MKEDCFAFRNTKNGAICIALTKMNCCKDRECRFYKTKEKYEQDLKEARKRLYERHDEKRLNRFDGLED